MRKHQACRLALLAVFAMQLTDAQRNSANQKAIAANFGTRESRTCASRNEPAKGALSQDLAKKYFICDEEKAWHGSHSFMELVTDVTLQIGKGRPYNPNTDGLMKVDMDPSELVYPIRGSFVEWECRALSDYGVVAGRNCAKWDRPNSAGTCFKNSFGEWHCKMTDFGSPPSVQDQPPPAGK